MTGTQLAVILHEVAEDGLPDMSDPDIIGRVCDLGLAVEPRAAHERYAVLRHDRGLLPRPRPEPNLWRLFDLAFWRRVTLWLEATCRSS